MPLFVGWVKSFVLNKTAIRDACGNRLFPSYNPDSFGGEGGPAGRDQVSPYWAGLNRLIHTRLKLEEVLEEILAHLGKDGLGVKLDAFDLHGLVAQSHDEAVRRGGGDLETRRQAFPFDNQGVVARGGERVRQSGEDGLAVMGDGAGLAVYQRGGRE